MKTKSHRNLTKKEIKEIYNNGTSLCSDIPKEQQELRDAYYDAVKESGYKQGRKDAIEEEIKFLIRLRRKANIKFGLIGFIEMIDDRIKEKEMIEK
jgi:hypothetical protein